MRAIPGCGCVPSGSMTLRVEGTLRFCANGKKTEVIEDGYDVRIEAPENFPERMALAWETGGRIPPDYHKLTNGALCLGSRVGLRLQMGGSPSLLRFVERCVIPYLYGYSYSVKHGAPPFGELGARRARLAPGPCRSARRRGLGPCRPLLHAGRDEETTREQATVSMWQRPAAGPLSQSEGQRPT